MKHVTPATSTSDEDNNDDNLSEISEIDSDVDMMSVEDESFHVEDEDMDYGSDDSDISNPEKEMYVDCAVFFLFGFPLMILLSTVYV